MIAFDTNVLVYACDKGNPDRQRKAIELIQSSLDGVLLWQVTCEFIAASRKLAAQGFTPEHAWNRLAEYRSLFPLILPTQAILERARALHTGSTWSFWDAMIVASCLDAGVTRLYTEDLPGRSLPGQLEIVNPFL
jgi:predicted nucleic acid-binding protein